MLNLGTAELILIFTLVAFYGLLLVAIIFLIKYVIKRSNGGKI